VIFFFLFNLLALAAIAYFAWQKQERQIKTLFWPGLVFKVCTGLVVGLVYKFYYTAGDTFYFFNQARESASLFPAHAGAYVDFLFHSDPGWKGAARTEFFVKMMSLVALFTGGNYWLSSVWFSLFSFLGTFYLFRTITQTFPESRVASAVAFLFFPSVVFWSSGLIKECPAWAALAVLSVLFIKLLDQGRLKPREIVLGFFCFWIVWKLKYYWLAVFLPVAVTTLIVNFLSNQVAWIRDWRWQFSIWIFLFLMLSFIPGLDHPNVDMTRLPGVVMQGYQAFWNNSPAAKLIQYPALDGSWPGIVKSIPAALASGLFRPMIWESDALIKGPAAMENSIVLVLFFFSISRLRGLIASSKRLLAVSSLVYIFLLCVFLALSTPNLGSLARYRVAFMPFFIFLILYKNPLINYFRFKKEETKPNVLAK
jgi:hypothetical protein